MLENDYFVFTEILTMMLRKQIQSIITGVKGNDKKDDSINNWSYNTQAEKH